MRATVSVSTGSIAIMFRSPACPVHIYNSVTDISLGKVMENDEIQ